MLIAGSLMGLCAIGLGAYTAHGARAGVATGALERLDTASMYALVHAAVLYGLGLELRRDSTGTGLVIAAWLLLVAVIVFCGGLMAHSLGGPGLMMRLTPFGGMLMLLGWLTLAWQGVRRK